MTIADFNAFMTKHYGGSPLRMGRAIGYHRNTLMKYVNAGEFPLTLRLCMAAIEQGVKPL